MIRVKRVYEPPGSEDGVRILVDRLWPRGLTKTAAKLDVWLKELGPSDQLRKWFNHDPGKWGEFKRRYFKELDAKAELVQRIAEEAGKGEVTIVFGSKEERFNNAQALEEYLGACLKSDEKKQDGLATRPTHLRRREGRVP